MAPARARSILTMAALLAFLLAGCTGPPPDAAEAPPPADPPAEGYRPNLFLLDGPRPVSARVSDGAEPSILADREGEFLWIGDTSGLAISRDNGTTWSRGVYPFLISADGWTLAQDDTGALYFATTSIAWIDVARSRDGGATAEFVARFTDAAPVADRPWLAARGDGELALLHYDYGRTFSESCLHSTDGGVTWLDRGVLGATPQGGNVVWDEAGRFHFVNNRGVLYSFGGTCLGGASSETIFPSLGANNMIQVAAEGSALYSAAASKGNSEILLWGRGLGTQTITVSPPELKSNTFATVSAHGDQVAVAWYGSETAGDPSQFGFSGAFNVYVAIVDDVWGKAGGPHIRHVRVTDEPNHVGDICMGGIGCGESADRDLLDYFMLDHDRWGGIHVAYGHDGAGSNPEVRHAHILSAGMDGAATGSGGAGGPGDDAAPLVSLDLTTDGLKVTADASGSSDPEGGELVFAWDMGDGTRRTGATVVHEYADAGAYEIHLTVRDEGQNVVERATSVVVDAAAANQAPQVSATIQPADPTVGQEVVFLAEGADPDGDTLHHTWAFGDGAEATGARVAHTYTAPGAYAVRLVTDDGQGARANQAATLRVLPAVEETAQPVAPESTNAPGAAVGLLVTFLVAGAVLLRRRP